MIQRSLRYRHGKKKKVLILPSWFPDKASEVSGIFIHDQARVLSRAYDVSVLVPRFVGWQGVIKGNLRPKTQVEQSDGIEVYREETLVPPGMKFFRLRTHLLAKLARRGFGKILMNWGKPDIIHAHVIFPGGWMAVNLGRDYAIPVVLTEHTGPFSVHLQSEVQRRVARETLRQVNSLIAVSPDMARQVHTFCPSATIHIVGNVIMTDFFTPQTVTPAEKLRSTTRFLSVALLNENKGMHYLLEAMQLLLQRGALSFELFIGGEGPTRPGLENMANELGLSGRCHFLGMLTRSEVKHWMQRSDVFVLPSLGETFGVVVCEAMACGKPVIATRCGGPEFVVTPETGILVDVADPLALADAMDKFISGQMVFDSNVIRRNIVTRFGEEAFLRNISAVYREL